MNYYIAYGSNLSIEQMTKRCPGAVLVGSAVLSNYRLAFRGNEGAYLTIEPDKNSIVPIGIWQITEHDESLLNQYEDYPVLYYKKDFQVDVSLLSHKMKSITAFAYIMVDNQKYDIPYPDYFIRVAKGYKDFNFDLSYLCEAYLFSKMKSKITP